MKITVDEARGFFAHPSQLRWSMLGGLDDLPEKVRDHQPAQLVLTTPDASELVSLDEIERRYILHALEVLGGNKALASQILGVDRRTLYRKLERYGHEPSRDSQ